MRSPPFATTVAALALLAAAWMAAGAGAAAAQTAAVAIEAIEARTEQVIVDITVVGTLESNESVIIRPEIAGRIAGIHFAEGERVRQGQLLVSLDTAVQEAELREAQAAVSVSQRDFQRFEELLQKGVGAARQRDEALGQLEAGRARVALAEARLQKMALTAPFDGILGLREASVGAYVTPGQDIVNLENIDPIKVQFRVPESSLREIALGQTIRIRVDAFPDMIFEGQVYAIDPRIDAESRSVAIRARIPNPESKLKPGLFARVSLIADERRNVVLPESAIQPQGAEQFVFKVVDGEAVLAKVTLGLRRAGEVEILDGVAPGDVVVVAGQLKLREGTPVNVTMVEAST